jgi:transcriptional regulator with XRE-family HTH domain
MINYITYKPTEAKEVGAGWEFVDLYTRSILQKRRAELNMTQQQVADTAKIQLRQYQRLESEERSITSASARIMLSVCAALKLDPYLFLPEFDEHV